MFRQKVLSLTSYVYDNKVSSPFVNQDEVKNKIKKITSDINELQDASNEQHELMEQLLELMDVYGEDLEIQRTCCHAISNIGMNVESAMTLLHLEAHKHLVNALHFFLHEDWKLCWLACSAIWNLARPEQTRQFFGVDTIEMVFSVMKVHGHKKKVMNTCLGSLSNLSLSESLKAQVGDEQNLIAILDSMRYFTLDGLVASTGCGLIANLAVNDVIAHKLVHANALQVISKIGYNYFNDLLVDPPSQRSFTKNLTASISNLSTSNDYKKNCIRFCIVELLFKILDMINNPEINSLCWNAIATLEITNDEHYMEKTTSLHLACKEGYLDEIKLLLHIYGDPLIHAMDWNSKYPLDYAKQHRQYSVIEFLIAVGSPGIRQEEETPNVIDSITRGCDRKRAIENYFVKILTQSCILCDDLARVVIDWTSTYSLIKSVDDSYVRPQVVY